MPQPEPPALPDGFRDYQVRCANGRGNNGDKKKMRELNATHIRNIEKYKADCVTWNHQRQVYDKKMEEAFEEWLKTGYQPPEELKEAIPYVSQVTVLLGYKWGISYNYSETELME